MTSSARAGSAAARTASPARWRSPRRSRRPAPNWPTPRSRPASCRPRCPVRWPSRRPARTPPSRHSPRSTSPTPRSRRSTSSSAGSGRTPAPPTTSGSGSSSSATSWRPAATKPSRNSPNSSSGCTTPSRSRRSKQNPSIARRRWPRQNRPAPPRWRRGWLCAPPKNARMPFADGRIRCDGRRPPNARPGCVRSAPARHANIAAAVAAAVAESGRLVAQRLSAAVAVASRARDEVAAERQHRAGALTKAREEVNELCAKITATHRCAAPRRGRQSPSGTAY